ncbi:MAG: hypothetical protein K0Q79_806 [Flavipsychrobacter sp.]|jgi:hypothetical protein|nr:hypothetical protein [Flavipsychrobacter sp.]
MKRLLIFLSVVLLAACNSKRHECTNYNPRFERYGPKSNEYKAELARQLQLRNFENIRYYIDKYEEIAGKPFMVVDIIGEELCAKGYIDIKNPNKMQKFKNVKGISYAGAEIVDFQYKIDTVDGKILFLFEEGKVKD